MTGLTGTIGRMAMLAVSLWLLSQPAALWAKTPEFQIVIRDHLFEPSTLEIPAGVKVRLRIINQDATPEEFESYELNREKVIMGNHEGTVFIGPLAPGEYPFFGEFNPKTAQGRIIAR